ncbi:class I SAM-dependent methyltransferase [Inhella sp.]|uniref:class I SAM-dependent methyltransferase n=1 Tax=Inhella sp. TaxID=1921806 RepID=UPI0035B00A79
MTNNLLLAIQALQLQPQATRLFHGRGGRHPGCEHLTLDWYPPCFLLTSFEQALGEAELAAVHVALAARYAELAPGQGLNWLYQGREVGGEERPTTRLMAGAVPEPHVVPEDGAQYLVHLLRGQNHGLFLDMAAGRQHVRAFCAARPGAKVLNLFAYSCAFSVAALQGGAAQVVNVDMSPGALALGRRNHELNGLPKGAASFLAHDLFKSWGKLTRGGPYELVIADPPSYQKGSFVATKDYARLARRLPELLAPGGEALVCLNTPKLGPEWLQQLMAEQAPTLQFLQRLPNPPAFADVDETRSLKVLVYRAPG